MKVPPEMFLYASDLGLFNEYIQDQNIMQTWKEYADTHTWLRDIIGDTEKFRLMILSLDQNNKFLEQLKILVKTSANSLETFLVFLNDKSN